MKLSPRTLLISGAALVAILALGVDSSDSYDDSGYGDSYGAEGYGPQNGGMQPGYGGGMQQPGYDGGMQQPGYDGGYGDAMQQPGYGGGSGYAGGGGYSGGTGYDSDASMAAWRAGQASGDEMQRRTINGINETVDLQDSQTGDTYYGVDNSSNNYWTNPGDNSVAGTSTYDNPDVSSYNSATNLDDVYSSGSE